MKAARLASLAFAALFGAATAARAVNLLLNGGFETPIAPVGGSAPPASSAFAWQGVALLFRGGEPGWPASGATGAQYADFGKAAASVLQNFTVPVGNRITAIAWSDAASSSFGGGTYTVTLLRLPAETVVAQSVFAIAAASGGNVVPWTPRALTLPAALPAPGDYRLRFVGTGITGSDYLVDALSVEAGPTESTITAGDGTVGGATLLGPTPYLRFADSPFASLSFAYFHLENWEDHALNTPGVIMEASNYLLSSTFGPGLIDSVDEDDGRVNGLNNDGAGHYGEAAWSSNGFRFSFDPAVLGAFPTHVGIVWTDGGGTVKFEAFDATGASLGVVEGDHPDGAVTGEVEEDRFYGVTCADGISAIHIWTGSPVEVDHLQYGRGPVLPLGSPFAYSANAGWINARPSVAQGLRVHSSFLSGRAYAANLGWIDFGDGTPASSSGAAYANTSAADSGVNRDATGNLSGYAYGANIGWINLGWAAPTDPLRPRTDLITGRFLGYAYSANVGWIDLGAVGLRHDTVAFPDTDLDGLPDTWEAIQFGDLATAGPLTDFDQDGSSDLAEYRAGTDPRNIDSPTPPHPSTISGQARHFYAANAGWIDARPNARHGLRVGEYFLSGWLSAPNFGWIHVGDGTPSNGHAYGNSSAAPDDYGVNLDATGAFSGYAYGANIGWLNFGWAAPNDPNRPRVDLSTGFLTGYVYAPNIGWITFDSAELRSNTLDRPDADADGMDDAWERENFSSLSAAGPGTDADHDGVTDASEYVAGTDPNDRSDYFRIVSETIADGLTQITLEFTSSETRRYRIEHTTQLAAGAWSDSPLGTFAPDPGTRTTRSFTLPAPAASRFFRAVAVLPLSP